MEIKFQHIENFFGHFTSTHFWKNLRGLVILLSIPIVIIYPLVIAGCTSSAPGVSNIYIAKLEGDLDVAFNFYGICLKSPNTTAASTQTCGPLSHFSSTLPPTTYHTIYTLLSILRPILVLLMFTAVLLICFFLSYTPLLMFRSIETDRPAYVPRCILLTRIFLWASFAGVLAVSVGVLVGSGVVVGSSKLDGGDGDEDEDLPGGMVFKKGREMQNLLWAVLGFLAALGVVFESTCYFIDDDSSHSKFTTFFNFGWGKPKSKDAAMEGQGDAKSAADGKKNKKDGENKPTHTWVGRILAGASSMSKRTTVCDRMGCLHRTGCPYSVDYRHHHGRDVEHGEEIWVGTCSNPECKKEVRFKKEDIRRFLKGNAVKGGKVTPVSPASSTPLSDQGVKETSVTLKTSPDQGVKESPMTLKTLPDQGVKKTPTISPDFSDQGITETPASNHSISLDDLDNSFSNDKPSTPP